MRKLFHQPRDGAPGKVGSHEIHLPIRRGIWYRFQGSDKACGIHAKPGDNECKGAGSTVLRLGIRQDIMRSAPIKAGQKEDEGQMAQFDDALKYLTSALASFTEALRGMNEAMQHDDLKQQTNRSEIYGTLAGGVVAAGASLIVALCVGLPMSYVAPLAALIPLVAYGAHKIINYQEGRKATKQNSQQCVGERGNPSS
ncbi:MAG: hypothetical protein ABII71_00825 [Candidatus Micrarchaeota archaeon]